jgi:TetR/AcrR family transcriptional regulator, cholesterol catabolism regulator
VFAAFFFSVQGATASAWACARPVRAALHKEAAMDQLVTHLTIRQKQKAETRDRVLAAARKLFEQRGYTAVTVRMISDEADVAVGSVFTAFDSKDDLLIAIICEDLANYVAVFTGVMQEKAELPLADRIVAAFEPAIAYDVAHTSKLREAMANSWTRTLDHEKQTRRALAPLVRCLRDAIGAAAKSGQLSADVDAVLLSEAVIHLYHGSIRRAPFDNWTVEQVASALRAQLRQLLR